MKNPASDGSVQLSREDILALTRGLSRMRHQVNNYLSLMLAAAELIQRKPESTQHLVERLVQQPPKVSEEIETFSRAVEAMLGSGKEDEGWPEAPHRVDAP